jgi:hypothetical protein
MQLPVTKFVPVPVKERYPNRYTGGYDSSIVTDKVKRVAQASSRRAPLNGNSTTGAAVAVKVYPGCVYGQK